MEAEQPQQRTSQTPPAGCDFQSRLGAFHDGELDAAVEVIVERHLASCEACRAELQEIRELSELAGQIGADGMSPMAIRRIHKAIDSEQTSVSIFRIAGALTGLAASVMVIGAAWLWDTQGPAHRSAPLIVIVQPGPADKWEYLAMNLKSDPLPKTEWEANNQQMVALTNYMVEGLSGSGR